MKYPSAPEAILRMLLSEAVSEGDAQHYLDNYNYFQDNRPQIEAKYYGKWVASLNGRIYAAESESQLEDLISKERDANRAYAEQVKNERCQPE